MSQRSTHSIPTLEQFLAAPLAEVRPVAPATMVWVVEGTRRSAALAGVPAEDYGRWSVPRMNACVRMFFEHGVRHVFTPFLTPSQFGEKTPGYRERLFEYAGLIASEPEFLAPYITHGWRVRLLGGDSLPELRPYAAKLIEATPYGDHTLWCSVVAETGAPWSELLQAVVRSGARTREEAISAVYGEDIPLATLMVAFGKPLVSPEQVPPLLVGKMDAYWTQRPGYRIDEREFRAILHDHAYVRRTWQEDKTGRPDEAAAFRRAWEEGPTLGLGFRLGPFWYPSATGVPVGSPG
ncbi:hypothetical protein [Nannocystis punicea]|uniref:Uncharacterized protein n=1 Tax=Nannocystis punicea TaxID=2995304 RepID=A0ABY7GY30_9BACT|nr:hypothetical protein [Nannocystis poenicansa]WAS91817.1 hypothetical protein O0S08_37010 [Nannocystis poenicansa]